MQLSPPAELHHRLVMRGCRFWIDGDDLIVEPFTSLSPDDIDELRQHKAEIRRRLVESDLQRTGSDCWFTTPYTVDGVANPSLGGRWLRWADFLRCPHCRWQDLVECTEGLRCVACDRLAWSADGDSIVQVGQEPMVLIPEGAPVPELHRRMIEAETAEHDARSARRLKQAIQRSCHKQSADLFSLAEKRHGSDGLATTNGSQRQEYFL